MSSYLRSKCSSSIQSGYSCIPGIVILTHLGFFPPFISFVRTGSLPSFTIVCFCQLYEETLFWLFLSIFYQNHSILCLYCLMGFLKTPYYSFWCGFQQLNVSVFLLIAATQKTVPQNSKITNFQKLGSCNLDFHMI